MNMRAFLRLKVLIPLILLAALGAQAHAEESLESLVRASDEETDDLKGFQLILRAIQVDDRTHELEREKRVLVRAHLVSRGFKAVLAIQNNDALACTTAHRVVTSLESYKPSSKEVGSGVAEGRFVHWPGLLLMLSVCLSHDGHSELARPPYQEAIRLRPHLRPKDRESLRSAFHMAESNLRASDPFRTGAYLTNKGVLQAWIGRIVDVDGDSVRVRITYTSNGEGVGELRALNRRESKPLTSVSLEALLRGWQ